MNAFVVYNPKSGGGHTGRAWPSIAKQLEHAIGRFSAAATQAPDHATRLVREAILGGARTIVAVGGDGTINEAINGLFGEDCQLLPGVRFAFLTCGTGGDFRRTFGIGDRAEDAMAPLARGTIRRLDIGRVTFLDHAGRTAVRHFANVASFGLSGAIAHSANRARISRLLGAKGMFYYKSVETLVRYRFQRIRIEVDARPAEECEVAMMAIANGRYFGGGMQVAPAADPGDGLFDAVLVHRAPKLELVRALNLSYTGAHVQHRTVRVTRARRVRVVPLEADKGPLLLEIDGETPGRLPATFEMLPAAVDVLC